jgi:hypothetical protein
LAALVKGCWPKNIFILCGTLSRPSATLGGVTEVTTIQGRRIGPPELAQVRALLAEHPDWSRYRLSRQLATLWDWRNPAGQLKDMAARTLLLKLAQRGWITLPACRCASPNRMRHKSRPALAVPAPAVPITGELIELRPLTIQELSQGTHRSERALFDALLYRHHYLSHRSTVGENLQYLVQDRAGRPLACVLFGAAAWQCRARDQHIGWDAATRQRRLTYITNNTRFLMVPWARVADLASHVLGRIARRLSKDWQRKYGHPIYLLETFVDTSRFQGTCYRAANWQAVGQTTGRTRQNKTQVAQAPPKAVWLYPLREDFRQALCAS